MLARLLQPCRATAHRAGQTRAVTTGSAAAKGVFDTAADAARAAAGAVRGAVERGAAAVQGVTAAGEPGWEERRYTEHGEEVEHGGSVEEHGGESDAEAVADAALGGAPGPRAMAASAGAPSEKFSDEYPDSGEWVEGGEDVYSARSAGGDGEAAPELPSDFDDEYPNSGEWVPAPGGTASAQWVRWKEQADEGMRGGKPEQGVALS